jgi:hypothetical protein
MTFLELCKRVRKISGVSGDGPSGVTGQTGIMERIVSWVLDAELDILMSKDDWQFLRSYSTGELMNGTHRYTVDSIGMSPAKYVKAIYVDGRQIEYVKWSDWMEKIVEYGDFTKTGSPSVVTLTPDQRLHFWPTPETTMALNVDYYKQPTVMADNADISAIPELYHQAIVHRALMFYADYEEDMYRYQRSEIEFNKWMAQLLVDQLPSSNFNRSLLCG